MIAADGISFKGDRPNNLSLEMSDTQISYLDGVSPKKATGSQF
jgi:hypothetical protein